MLFGACAQILSAISAKFGASELAPSTGGSLSPLLLAASKGHIACLTVLLDALPDNALNESVDAHGRTALMCAASSGSAAAVELLVKRGAAIDDTSADGKTALMWAINSHKPATVAALARLGADPDIAMECSEVVVPGQDRSKGETAMDLANARHAKDPTLRHIAKYMLDWRDARLAGGGAPEMPPIPWVVHAEAFKVKEEAEAAEAAAKAAMAADEPMIEEVGEARAAADDNDIFGDDDAPDVADAVPVGGAAEASLKAQAEDAQKAIAADADLDELD